MKASDVLTRIHFHSYILLPFGVAFILLAFVFGCQKKEAPKAAVPSITLENLQTAYAKQVRHQRMYSMFVTQAEKEKIKPMADLFRAVARSEEIHASNHVSLLTSRGVQVTPPAQEPVVVGTTLQTLKMALSSEEIEVESMFPNLIKSAAAEKFTEAADLFERTKESDARQQELLKDALDKSGKIAKTVFFVCPTCGYIFTSDKTDECPICKTKKESFQRI